MAIAGATSIARSSEVCMASAVGLRCSSPRVEMSSRGVSFPKRSSQSAFFRTSATCVAPMFNTPQSTIDGVLVRLQTFEQKAIRGTLLSTAAQRKGPSGEVVEVGDQIIESSVLQVDFAIYSKSAGTETYSNGGGSFLLKDGIEGLVKGEDIKQFKPLNDRVLVKVSEVAEKTAGGVLLTNSSKEKPSVGEVVAAGAGTIGEDGKRKPLQLEMGDNVLFSKYAGDEFKGKDGTLYVVLRAEDVLALLS